MSDVIQVAPHLTKSLVISFLSLSFDHILRTPEEVLKREQTDLLCSLVRGLGQTYLEVVGDNGGRVRGLPTDESYSGVIQGDSTSLHFLEFWYLLILRALSSSSLLLRLWGVGELGELVGEVRRLRPPARSYKVLGAGTYFINGVYNVVADKVVAYGHGDHTLQYTKGDGDEDDPIITLFRCTMRNSKSKWWFLSQADKEKPGTDKDIDYYLHRTPAEEDREPPASGWQNNHTGMRVLGKCLLPQPLLPIIFINDT
ncbi:hypothetical protein EON64_15125 [archaeon]|nr:MAG: hypothetical protein EON64_15125 [archaeon]